MSPLLRQGMNHSKDRLRLLLDSLLFRSAPLPAAQEPESDDRDDHYGREALPTPSTQQADHETTVGRRRGSARNLILVRSHDDALDSRPRCWKCGLCLRGDFRWCAVVALASGVGDHDGEVGENHGTGNQHPSGPPGNEDRADDAGGSDAHGDEVLAGTPRLLVTESPLGAGDRMRGFRHPNKVNPFSSDRASVRSGAHKGDADVGPGLWNQ